MRRGQASLGLLHHQGFWFLQRRDPSNGVLPGLWEFPGGKLEPGESPIGALLRELEEELGWQPSVPEALPPVAGPGGRVLHPFRCEAPGCLRSPLAWGWFTAAEVARLPIPAANRDLLRWLRVEA